MRKTARVETLDVGCGKPGGPNNARKRGTIGIDIERGFADIICDAHYLPFHDSIFVSATLHSCLDHMQNPLRVLEEVARVTTRTISVTVLNPAFWQLSFAPTPEDHLFCWRPGDLIHLLAKAGFKTTNVTYGTLDKRRNRLRNAVYRFVTLALWGRTITDRWFLDVFRVTAEKVAS